MTDERPVACSLSASDLQGRYRDLAGFGKENLIARSTGDQGEELRFRRSPANESRLRSIVAAEEECCPFLDFHLTDQAGELVLKIAADEDGRPVAALLASAFG